MVASTCIFILSYSYLYSAYIEYFLTPLLCPQIQIFYFQM